MDKLHRCLIVEDEMFSATLIQNHLREINNFNTPQVAHSIHDALEEIKNHHFDLIFCDIHLPDGNAINFLKSVSVETPVILITGDRNQSLEAYQMDVIDYIIKPVTRDRFEKALRKYFEITIGRKQLDRASHGEVFTGNNLENILIRRYLLSKTEAAICRSISDGNSQDEILAKHSITINTYKSHMKKIFAKTIERNAPEKQKSQGKLQRLTLFLLELKKEGH